MIGILKIELSTVTSAAPRQTMRVRSQDGSIDLNQPVTPEIMDLMGFDTAAYFKARVRQSGKLKILKRVRDRHW